MGYIKEKEEEKTGGFQDNRNSLVNVKSFPRDWTDRRPYRKLYIQERLVE